MKNDSYLAESLKRKSREYSLDREYKEEDEQKARKVNKMREKAKQSTSLPQIRKQKTNPQTSLDQLA